MKRYNRKKNIRWNTMRILAAGFLFVIVTGAVLLWLPVSNQKPIEFFDALFTSASAVCVTGNDSKSANLYQYQQNYFSK